MAGVDYPTPELGASIDPVTGIANQLSGTCPGEPISVAFRPNPVRQVRIQARLRNRGTNLSEPYKTSTAADGARLKLSLCGPYTLSRLSFIETTAYSDYVHLAHDLSNHLADEVRHCVRLGARLIQVDEPWILQAPEDIRLVRELLEPLQDAVEPEGTLIVATYGAAVGDMFAHLNSLPGAAVGLDCTSSPEIIADLAATGSGKPLALGLIGLGEDGDIASLARDVKVATRRYQHEILYLQPACSLDTLDTAVVDAKLRRLAAVRSEVLANP